MDKEKERIFTLPLMMILVMSVISGAASYMVNPVLPAFLVSKVYSDTRHPSHPGYSLV